MLWHRRAAVHEAEVEECKTCYTQPTRTLHGPVRRFAPAARLPRKKPLLPAVITAISLSEAPASAAGLRPDVLRLVSPEEANPAERDREYTCIATVQFHLYLMRALDYAWQRQDNEGTAPDDPSDFRGSAELARLTGLDVKTVKRIARFQVLTIELDTADVILSRTGQTYVLAAIEDLVLPMTREAATRMARERAEAALDVWPPYAVRELADELWHRRCVTLAERPEPFIRRRMERNLYQRQKKLEATLGRPLTDVEVTELEDDVNRRAVSNGPGVA